MSYKIDVERRAAIIEDRRQAETRMQLLKELHSLEAYVQLELELNLAPYVRPLELPVKGTKLA